MLAQIDEQTSERHLRATFIEFLEAITRVMERASMPDINTLDTSELLSLEERKNLPIATKVEHTIPYLMSLCS